MPTDDFVRLSTSPAIQLRCPVKDNGVVSMIELCAGGQTIRYDREATAAIYASLAGGWAEGCGCVGCRNLMQQRDSIYPAHFLALLDQVGIDFRKEGEAVADGPLENGLHRYGGWFFLVGEMTVAGDSVVEVCDSPYFAYFFTRGGPCPKEFSAGPHIGIEFIAHFKWVLPDRWDSDSRPPASR